MRFRACLTRPRQVGDVAGESELVDGGERVLYYNMVSRRTRHEREDTHEPVSAAGLKVMAKGGGRKGRRDAGRGVGDERKR